MKIVPNSEKEISMVSASVVDNNCIINWSLSSGGIIICLSSGLNEFPNIEKFNAMNDEQWKELLSKETFYFTFENGETVQLRYLSEKTIQAYTSGYKFPLPANFSPPLKIQLWRVNPTCDETYSPMHDTNRCIVKAEATATISSLGFFRSLFLKGKKVKIKIKQASKYPDGIICYTVPNSPVDINGNLYEYPIPKQGLTNEFIIPFQGFNLIPGDGFKDLINLKVISS